MKLNQLQMLVDGTIYIKMAAINDTEVAVENNIVESWKR